MNLVSLFQLLDRSACLGGWPANMWYVKFDFSQAFFNIPVKRESRRFLAFKVDGKCYRFRVLSFGLREAAFVCQTHLESIMTYIRSFGVMVHGHIDDLLVGSPSSRQLITIVM